MTMREAVARVHLSRQTLIRWEKAGRIPPPRRDYKNDRVYSEEDIQRIIDIKEEIK